MSIDLNQLNQITENGQVVTSDGEKIGSIGQVYLDDATGEPSWVTVKTGFFGTSENFVPIHAARTEGDDIVVDYDKETVKSAPRVDADGSITPEEEQTLYQHYNMGGTGGNVDGRHDQNVGTDVRTDRDTDRDLHDTDRDLDDADRRTDRDVHDTDRNADDAMTRSEERLSVDKESVETGKAKLRKYVVTENVTTTVPVSHEEVRMVREPITDADAGEAMSGSDLGEEEHEVVLHAERPVVEKETVPVEKIRLDSETVTEQQEVSADVRKEKIDYDDSSSDLTDRR